MRGVRAVSIAEAVPDLAGQTVLVNGVAKTYAMTGWRVGWMVGPPAVVKAGADLLLERCEVAVVPGEAFGPSGYLRFSYALGDEALAEGVRRLADFFA